LNDVVAECCEVCLKHSDVYLVIYIRLHMVPCHRKADVAHHTGDPFVHVHILRELYAKIAVALAVWLAKPAVY
jgi:hypothetical protein